MSDESDKSSLNDETKKKISNQDFFYSTFILPTLSTVKNLFIFYNKSVMKICLYFVLKVSISSC